jgi:hypothetical protein
MDEFQKFARQQRLGKQVALAKVAVCRYEQVTLYGVFNAFRNHFRAQFMGHTDDRFTQGTVLGTLVQVPHEGLVYFQKIDVVAMQIRRWRVAGSEVVQRQMQAALARCQQFLLHPLRHIKQQPPANFNDDSIKGQINGTQIVYSFTRLPPFALKLPRRLAHRDLDSRVYLFSPIAHLLRSRMEHPFADFLNQAYRLGKGNELIRKHHTTLWMLLADECFDLTCGSGAQIHNGL